MLHISSEQLWKTALWHQQHGRIAEAETICRQILAQQPVHMGAGQMLAVLSGKGSQTQGVDEANRKSILLYNRGDAHQAAGRLNEAIACYQEALRLKPDFADAYINLGNVHKATGRLDDAVECYLHAARINPNLLAAQGNLGVIRDAQGRYEEAVAHYREALRIDPRNGEIYLIMGVSLTELGRFQEAVACFRRAVDFKADPVVCFYNLGYAFRQLGQLDEAIAANREAIRLRPGFGEAYNNLGVVLGMAAEHDEGIKSLRRAVELRPGRSQYHSNLLFWLHFQSGWTARALLEEHLVWNRRHAEPLKALIQPHTNNRDPGRRLRVGYVSPDFRQHPVGRFMLGLLAAHDRGTVESFCYADGAGPDAMTERLRGHADQWRPISGKTDEQVAALVREDGIDILVDLSLHAKDSRLLVFARKPAPVQVTYLGYCSTTGMDTIDYRISDRFLDPIEWDMGCYTEETVRVETYWCYPESAEAPAVNELPALATEGGKGVTFGCLNNYCKVTTEALRVWGALLKAVPESRLILHPHVGSHREQVKQLLRELGVEPARCEFIGFQPSMAEYFRTYHQIDIALDPFPFAGGTTTCDALWMGVPVVTLAGKTAVGRQGVSILSNLGLEELVARDEGGYVEIAAGLAKDLGRLKELRAGLRERMRGSALMDGARFARGMEGAYREMWRRWCAGGGDGQKGKD